MWQTSVAVRRGPALSLHMLEWSREGPPCLLIHGIGDAACVWNEFAPWISSSFRTIAVDLRGHGNSDWDPEARYDAETLAEDLRETMAALSIERVVLIGHSLGGDVAIRFASKADDRVRGLVIVDMGPEVNAAGLTQIGRDLEDTPRHFGSAGEYFDWLRHRRPLAHPSLLQQLANYNLRAGSSGSCEPKFDSALGRQERLVSVNARGRRCDDELWAALERIKCPSLVIRGVGSSVLPEDVARRMVERALSNGKLAVVPRAGHAVMMDNPEGFKIAVSGFLSDLAA